MRKQYEILYKQICKNTKTFYRNTDKLTLRGLLGVINTLLNINNCTEITDREIEYIMDKEIIG